MARVGDSPEASGSVVRTKKRSAGLSCAECRRLKLRCDRNFPCSACVKRGCSAICPEGSLTTGKGNRFVLANTEVLHEKISELSQRVRELEDALSESYSENHSDRHHLLRDELLRIKNPLERDVGQKLEPEPEEAQTVDALGSLSISESGRSNFYGKTANSVYLLQNEDSEDSDEDRGATEVESPVDIPWLSHTFPFTPRINQTAAEMRMLLMRFVPDYPVAIQLVDCYFNNAAWMYHPIPKQYFDAVLQDIYRGEMMSPTSPFELAHVDGHQLALFFAVLALGTFVDISNPPNPTTAAQYYHLSRAALSLDSVLEKPSILAIQALLVICHYLFLSHTNNAPRWTLMGIIVKMAQSLGLHRDSTRWNLDPEETQRRRELMWEIYVYDSWQSLTYGRPPSFSLVHIDCKPAYSSTKDASGQDEMSFAAWKQRFCSECLAVVHNQAFGARNVSYSTILELDKKVRNYYIPPSLMVPGFGGSSYMRNVPPPTMQLTMQQHVLFAIKEITLLYMHRGFFAKAMEEHTEDPLGSKYGQSVLSIHRSASSFVAMMGNLWMQYKELAEKNWFLFTHLFSCAIVLGSIPIKCPSVRFARSALQSLDQAYELFSKVADLSKTAKILPILQKLNQRAHASMNEHASHSNSIVKQDPVTNPLIKQEDDELAVLGGKTRLVPHKSYSSSSSSGSKSPTSTPETSQLTYIASPSTYTDMMQTQGVGFGAQASGYSSDMPMYTLGSQPQVPQAPVSWSPEVYSEVPYMQMPQMPQMQHMQHIQQPMHQQHQPSSNQYSTDFVPDHSANTGNNLAFEYPIQTRAYNMVAQQQQPSISPQNSMSEHTHTSLSPQLMDPEVSWGTWVAQFNTL